MQKCVVQALAIVNLQCACRPKGRIIQKVTVYTCLSLRFEGVRLYTFTENIEGP
jgi:hypothetical protein